MINIFSEGCKYQLGTTSGRSKIHKDQTPLREYYAELGRTIKQLTPEEEQLWWESVKKEFKVPNAPSAVMGPSLAALSSGSLPPLLSPPPHFRSLLASNPTQTPRLAESGYRPPVDSSSSDSSSVQEAQSQ